MMRDINCLKNFKDLLLACERDKIIKNIYFMCCKMNEKINKIFVTKIKSFNDFLLFFYTLNESAKKADVNQRVFLFSSTFQVRLFEISFLLHSRYSKLLSSTLDNF